MNKNALKWVEALESGEYKQGKGWLVVNDSYCCLGVACVLYAKAKRIKDAPFLLNKTMEILPAPVQRWLGLDSTDGSYRTTEDLATELTTDNDRTDTAHKSFKQIAKLIRTEPQGLFKT